MEKIIEWINNHKKKTLCIIIGIIIIPLIGTHIISNIPSPSAYLVAVWEPGDLLGYAGDVLSFLGTIVLGYIAVTQSDNANKLSMELAELEWKRHQPCFDIVSGQPYKIYLGDEIDEYKLNRNIYEELYITPCLIANPQTGNTTSIALMEIIMTNSGNSDIRKLFIKNMKFYLSTKQPLETQKPFFFSGNQSIKKGETRKFIIEFEQELVDSKQGLWQQVNWITKDIHILKPHLEFSLILETTDGIKYEEILKIGSNWSKPLKNDGLILERIPHIINLQVTKINSN